MTKKEWFLCMSDRYIFDFGECSVKNGYAQVDTDQDAWYHGIWANPTARIIFRYCEGDVTKIVCDTDEEFKTEMESMVKWQVDSGHFKGIDGMCNEDIIKAFKALGFGELLH